MLAIFRDVNDNEPMDQMEQALLHEFHVSEKFWIFLAIYFKRQFYIFQIRDVPPFEAQLGVDYMVSLHFRTLMVMFRLLALFVDRRV